MTEKWLITPTEAAKRMSIGRTTMYHMLASGFPHVTIGRLKRIPVEAVERWIRENTQGERKHDG